MHVKAERRHVRKWRRVEGGAKYPTPVHHTDVQPPHTSLTPFSCVAETGRRLKGGGVWVWVRQAIMAEAAGHGEVAEIRVTETALTQGFTHRPGRLEAAHLPVT